MTRLPCALALALTLVACVPPTISAPVESATAQPTSAPSHLSSVGRPTDVEANGKCLIIRCFGEGTSSVVLKNRYGVDWTEWKEVIAGFEDRTRICSYDRITPAATSMEAADNLYAMLSNAGLAPPYGLAGHSLGGFTVILFASRHPEEVAGVALIDSSHPDGEPRTLAILPTPSVTESQELKDLREGL